MAITLELIPDESNYILQRGSDVIAHAVAGGVAKYRRVSLKPTGKTLPLVTVTWKCTPVQYTYLKAFYRLVQFTAASFLITIILEDSTPAPHTVKFVPGSLKLASVMGLEYTVTAELDVLS
jgi:hypothetical protein